jgi:hypothetical protein
MYDMIPKQWFQQKMTTEQLNTINQATIKYMMNDLKPVILQQPQSSQYSNNNNNFDSERRLPDYNIPPEQSSYGSSLNNHTSFLETKSNHTDVIQSRFLEKQKEMESMLNAKAPSEVNFKIDEIDEPISNMEELIKQHMSQRELDIQPITSSIIPKGTDRPKLVIMEELDQQSVRDARNVQVPVLNIITPSIVSHSEINEKHVTFHEQNHADVEILQMKTQIQTLQNDVSQLKTMMHDFLEKISKPQYSDEISYSKGRCRSPDEYDNVPETKTLPDEVDSKS